MIAVKDAPRRTPRGPGEKYAKALATHQRMEAELSRAMNRWQKSRKALWACEKRLDKAMATQAEAVAAEPDFDDTL